MTALLKIIPIEKLIRFLIQKMHGITAEQWKQAVDIVCDVAEDLTNPNKADSANAKLAALLPKVRTNVLDMIRSLAVSFARKKGWIQ